MSIELCTITIVPLMLLMAVFYDLKSFRIPNRLNAVLTVLGLFTSLVYGGVGYFGYGAIGVILPFFILYFLFYVRIVGAGDIKLLCGIGSFVHLGIVKIIILSFILTACMGVLIVTVNIVSAHYTRTKQLTRIHLSIPIALATAIYLCVG